ncbi:hypothetical protein Dimus_026232 [Dionaea muscipula]
MTETDTPAIPTQDQDQDHVPLTSTTNHGIGKGRPNAAGRRRRHHRKRVSLHGLWLLSSPFCLSWFSSTDHSPICLPRWIDDLYILRVFHMASKPLFLKFSQLV